MADPIAELVVRVGADISGLAKGLMQAEKSAGDFAAKGFGGLQKAVGVGLAGAVGIGAAALGGMTALLHESIGAAKEAEQGQAQLNAVLASTKGVAGITANAANEIASSLQKVTAFEDDAILAGENMLLTFTNIGKDIFPDATEVMLDMSQALGQDLKSRAIQLGKALQDPVAGVTALKRVGVNFTDDQRDLIKAMVESGDVMGAQRFILKELQTEFGGAARAMGQTAAGQAAILQNTMGDLKEEIGGALLPIVGRMMEMFGPIAIAVLGKLSEFVSGTLAPAMNALMNIVQNLATEGFGALFSQFEDGSSYLGAIFELFGMTEAAAEGLSAKIISLVDSVTAFLSPIADAIGSFVSWKDVLITLGIVVASIVIPALVGILATVAPIIAVFAALVGAVALLRTAWENDWGGMRTFITDWWNTTGKGVLANLQTWLGENIPKAIKTLTTFWENTLLPALKVVWGFIKDYLIPMWLAIESVGFEAVKLGIKVLSGLWQNVLLPALKTVWQFIKEKILPIFSGLSDSFGGISDKIRGAIDWLRRLADTLRNLSLPAWLTPGSPTPFEMGLRGIGEAMRQLARYDAPMFGGGLAAAGAGGRGNTSTFNITVNAGGGDPATVRTAVYGGVLQASRSMGLR